MSRKTKTTGKTKGKTKAPLIGEAAALADLKTKAKAAEAKAKTEAALAAKVRDAATKALAGLIGRLQAAEAALDAASLRRDEAELTLGRILLEADAIIAKAGKALDLTIGKWATEYVPRKAGPVWGSSPAYRALQAARVAARLDEGTPLGSTDALTPLHRTLPLKGKATERVYAKALKAAEAEGHSAPMRRHVEAALEALYPASHAKGSRGPGKGKGNNGKAKAASAAKAKAATGPVEVPDLAVTATRLKAAATRIAEVLGPEPTPRDDAVAIGVMGCVTDYGQAATAAALKAAEDRHAKALKVRKAAKGKSRKAAKGKTT